MTTTKGREEMKLIYSHKFILDGKLFETRSKHGYSSPEANTVELWAQVKGDRWAEVYKHDDGTYVYLEKWRGCAGDAYARLISETDVKDLIGRLDVDGYLKLFGAL